MKNLLTFLFLLNVAFAQQSWVNVLLQTDQYAGETSWEIYQDDSLVASSPMYQSNAYEETLVFLPEGSYSFVIYDAFGDGICCAYGEGWFGLKNSCGVESYDYEFAGATQTVYFDLLACPPPAEGCTDAEALNYDANAIVDDMSCEYPPCTGIENVWVDESCVEQATGSRALLYYNWESPDNSQSCNIEKIYFGNDNDNYTFSGQGVDDIWGVYAGSVNMPPNWSEEYYWFLEFVDGTVSDTVYHTPSACVEGCMDESADNYNPFATIDDGSCEIIACAEDQTEITLQLTLDNYPSEISWILYSGGQIVDQAIQGDYDYADANQTFSYTYCVYPFGTELQLQDTYGDGLASSSTGGDQDGDFIILACNGDTLWDLPEPDFDNLTYSGTLDPVFCEEESITGCMNPEYVEFNPLATISDEALCQTPSVFGCVDDTMFNYNASATAMSIVPQCTVTVTLEDDGGDGWGNSYIGITQGDTSHIYTMGPGSYTESWDVELNTNEEVEVYYFQVGNGQQLPDQLAFQTLHNSVLLTNQDGDTLLSEGSNPFFSNGQGALQPFRAPLWNSYSTMIYCGNYCEPFTYGCMDLLAVNYTDTVNTEDGSCYYLPGCTSPAFLEYYTQGFEADYDDNSCQTAAIWGCTDNTMYNYDSTANISNGGCISFVYGCMDPTAFNYDPLATAEGECIAYYYGCTDPTAFNYDPAANADDESCYDVVLGCMDVTAFNYNALANTDDGGCIETVFGCIDNTMYNYNPEANTSNGSCIEFYYGCTDSLALNYDDNANTDNGSCVYPLYGCTNPTAINYNIDANMSDSSCYYSAGCAVGDIYYIPNECFSWVIEVDPFCCDNEWDNTCQELYTYCLDGWTGPTDITEFRNSLVIYPNPTSDYINVSKKVDAKVFNVLGKLILSKKDINVLDVSKLQSGMYNVIFEYNNVKINKRIIKQ